MKEHDPMSAAFGLAVLVTALAGVAAVLSSRVSERLRIPAPAFFLIAAAAAADLWPRLGGLSFTAVENVVSVALAVILFDGGMRVGWRRLRPVAGPTLWIGVAGTLVTAGGVAAAAAHGSGFLAVFVAGLVIGDERAPYQREIARFHSALASLAEIVAFAILGLTIQLHKLAHDWAWLAGLVLAVLLSLVIRPLLVGLLLWPVSLRPGERICVLWAGLKGAVPILLGAFIVQAGAAGAHRLYEIIFVVVTFSVIAQGGTVPWLLRRLRIPLRTIDPEPWSLGVRFTREPEGLRRFTVLPGAAADATQVGDVHLAHDAWISLIIRNGRLVPVRPDTVLRAGDEAVVLSADPDAAGLSTLFTEPRRDVPERRGPAC
jgi:potassium/hydrogen antiporter